MNDLITKLYHLALSSQIVSKLLEPAHIIILLLPFLTFLLAVITLSLQKHHQGTLKRSQIFATYVFIFYLAALYLLIVLPLPTRASVAATTGAEYNLRPFFFLEQFKLMTPFKLNNVSTWLAAFTSDSFFQPFFNALMMIPLGIFLHKNIHWPFWLTALCGFGLSLFFETTQLTGLYGYYPRAYRMFDVDDLLMNTLGTMLGFWLTPVWQSVLQRLPHQSITPIASKGRSWTRLAALGFDWLCIAIFDSAYFILVKHFNWPLPSDFRLLYLLDIVIVFLLPGLLLHGRTVGNLLFGGQLTATAGTPTKPWQILLHYVGLYLVALPLLFLDVWLFNRTGNVPTATLNPLDISIVLVTLILIAVSYDFILNYFDTQHPLLFDRIAHVQMID